MSIGRKAIEVKVRVGKVIKAYLYYHDEGVKSHKQAAQKAKKHGKIISVEKVDTQALLGRIEKLDLSQNHHLGGGIFEEELNIDELLGLRNKTKRRLKHERQRGKTGEEA